MVLIYKFKNPCCLFKSGVKIISVTFSRKEIEEVQAEHPDRFQVWYTVDRPSPGNTSSLLVHCLESTNCRISGKLYFLD